MLLAIGIPLICMVATPNPGQSLAFVNAAVSAVVFVWLARHRRLAVQIVAGVIGAIVVRGLEPAADLRWVTIVSVILILAYWLIGRFAEQRDERAVTSKLTRQTLVSACAVIVVAVAALKYAGSLQQERPDPGQPNDNWYAAQQAATAGLDAGSKIALVGSPFEAYWVRVARARIVAVVPPPVMSDFNALAVERRQRLFDEFSKAGADFIVVQQANPPQGADRSWIPIRYIGWVKRVR
jgi:hypothetical protein